MPAMRTLAWPCALTFSLGLLGLSAQASPSSPAPRKQRVMVSAQKPAAPSAQETAALRHAADARASSIVTVDALGSEDDEAVQRRGVGVLMTAGGTLLAPLFLVEDADTIMVSSGSDFRSPAQVIATDPACQLAVLRTTITPPEGRAALKLSGAAGEQAAAQVVLLSLDPAGMRHLFGSVAGRRPQVGPLKDVLEVTVQGAPGALGGIVLNGKGEVVGLALATLASGAAADGRARVFILPASRIRQAVGEILKRPSVEPAEPVVPVSVSTT